MLIAWLKLRQRNLGPILDANGWAVNGSVRVPVSLGRSLTSIAQLPQGTVPAMDDKFAEPPVVWPKIALFLVVLGVIYSLLNYYGFIHQWTDGKWGDDPRLRKTSGLSALLPPQPGTGATNAPAAP